MAPFRARHTVTGPPTGSATHAARPAVSVRRMIAVVGAGVVLAAGFGWGAWALLGSAGPSKSTPTSARLITVSPSVHP